VGKQEKLHEFSANNALKHCEAFTAIIDVELEPGDIIYIPSGYPHEGYAIEPSLNYSVGFRAPDQNDLLSSFADHCLDSSEEAPRYTDIDMQIREKPGQIETLELNELHRIMLSKCQTPEALIPWFGCMISEAKHELDIAEIDPPHRTQEIQALLIEGAQFIRLGGLRAVYFEASPNLLFINGSQFNCEGFSELGHYLCDQDEIGSEAIDLFNENNEALTLFTQLINMGYWYVI